MKKFFNLFAAALFISVVLISCGGNAGNAPEIKELKGYTDIVNGMSLNYPADWVVQKLPGARFVVVNSNEGKSRFQKYDPTGFPGTKIDITMLKLDSVKTLEYIAENSRGFDPSVYKTSSATIDGAKAIKLDYTFELNSGVFNGVSYIVTKDNIIASIITIEGFDGTLDLYKAKIDEILASIKLPVYKEAAPAQTVAEELPPPSQNLVAQKGMGYTIMIPDNFNPQSKKVSGTLESRNYMGERRGDCNILVDVIDASKSKNLGKISEELHARYPKAGALKSANIGGLEAKSFDYQPAGSVKGKVFVALKGDKLYRISMNWFTGEEKDYLPIFQKSIASIKFD